MRKVFAICSFVLAIIPDFSFATPSKKNDQIQSANIDLTKGDCEIGIYETDYLCVIEKLYQRARISKSEKDVQELESYLYKTNLSPQTYLLVFASYELLLDQAVSKNNFDEIIRNSNLVIEAFTNRQDNYSQDLYKFYKERGIAIFKKGTQFAGNKYNWDRPSEVKFWIESVTDLRNARVAYGKQKSATDIEYMQTVLWDLAIDGYFRSMSTKSPDELEMLRLKPIIQPSPNVIATYSSHSVLCAEFGRISTSLMVPKDLAKDFQYGAAIAYYDLDKDKRIINVRVPLVVPNDSLAKFVKEKIEEMENVPNSQKTKELPEECFKDRLALIRIIK